MKKKTDDPLQPTLSLLVKLGSIAIHAEEYLSPNGHPHDKIALDSCLQEYEVQQWLQQMNAMALLPVKRSATPRADAPAQSGGEEE